MKNKITSVELMFSIKLKLLIENNSDISSFTKLAVLTGYSETGAKLICYKLKDKNIISLETVKGRNGSITLSLLIDPYTLINA